MSIFNKGNCEVYDTKILVFKTRSGRQLTIYSTHIKPRKMKSTSGKLEQLIIPVPVITDMEIEPIDISSNQNFLVTVNSRYDLKPKSMVPPKKAKGKGVTSDEEAEESVLLHYSVLSSLRSYRELKKHVDLSSEAAKILEDHYSKGFGFLICTFNPLRGIDQTIAYIHDLLPNDEYYVPLRRKPISSDHELVVPDSTDDDDPPPRSRADFILPPMDHIVYSLNSMENRGAGIICLENTKSIQKALSIESLKPHLPRTLNLRRLYINPDRENEDLVIPVDPNCSLDDKIYLLLKKGRVVDIRGQDFKTAIGDIKIINYKEELTPLMYVITKESNGSWEPIIISSSWREISEKFRSSIMTDYISDMPDLELKVALSDGCTLTDPAASEPTKTTSYQLSIVSRE